MDGGVRRIEIVGVAGAGKSTLARTLLARHPVCRLADFIHARVPSHWPYFAHSAPGAARLLAHALRPPRPSWDELKLYVYASEWHRYLAAREDRSSVTLFDQGPFFALACLLWGGSAVTDSSPFRRWRQGSAARWARELDLVVELTAADEVLLARIDAREKAHVAKGRSPREAARILAAHRHAYAEVLGDVEGSIRVLRFDTSRRSADTIADDLAGLFSPRLPAALDGTASHPQPAGGVTRAVRRDGIEELGSIR